MSPSIRICNPVLKRISVSRTIQSQPIGRPPNSHVSLVSQVSRAALWNTILLPVLGVLNVAFAVLIRRRFGLFSGVYDVLLGLSSTLAQHSGIGIGTALLKFLPEVSEASGRGPVRRLLRDAVIVRMLLLLLVLVPLNLFVEPVVQVLELGPSGRLYIGLVSGLVVARALLLMMVQALNAFFAQMWSNLIAVLQAVLELAAAGAMLALGYQMGGVFAGLVAAGTVAALLSTGSVWWQLAHLDPSRDTDESDRRESDPAGLWFSGEGRRFFRFSVFTYVFGLSVYFTGMGFVAPALAVVLSTEDVALFATAYKLSFSAVGLVVASFRGVYRPLFARVRVRKDRSDLQRTFIVVSKAQLVVLFPAGLGLMVMSGDYVPLLFGAEFTPAVPLVWLMAGFMYATTAFNLSGIVLSIDEQYRAIAWVRAPVLLSVPIFLLVAARGGLVQASIVFGATGLLVELLSYAICHRLYGFRFPWTFAGRIGVVSATMAAALVVARTVWTTSLVEAVTLTVAGATVVVIGLRLNRVFGPDELRLLRQTELPGHAWVANWFATKSDDAPTKAEKQ